MLWKLLKKSFFSSKKNTSQLTSDEIIKFIQTAMSKRQSGQFHEAEKICNTILSSEPRHSYALYVLALTNIDHGDNEQGGALLLKAIENNPNEALFHNSYGELLLVLGEKEAAIKHLNIAIEINPEYHDAYCNLGNAYFDLNSYAEAINNYKKALQFKPDFFNAYNNLGSVFYKQKKYEEAVECFKDAILYSPTFAEAHYNLGTAYLELEEYDDAVRFFKSAIVYKSNFAQAHVNLAIINLLLGKYEEGWKEYEWRLGSKVLGANREFKQPKWNGSDLTDKTILLHAEQGLGDTIQFIRYVPMVAEKGGQVIVECATGIIHLFDHYKDIANFVGKGEDLPFFDVHCPLLSLPGIFNTTYQTIPVENHYIYSNDKLVALWEEKLTSKKKLKVGICWQGDKIYFRDEFRSIPLKLYKTLLSVEDVDFISLQKGEGQEQIAESGFSSLIIDNTSEMDNELKFEDTIAVIQNLDLIIGVDTSIIHLAGAMGKPVWVLLATFPNWPWLLKDDKTPWYSSMRFYRQKNRGDWLSVINNVVEDLIKIRDEKII